MPKATCKLMIVGDFWGEAETAQRMPFVGSAGHELTRMLQEVGIERSDAALTNVFNFQPPRNDVTALCARKAEVTNTLPPVMAGKYLRDEFLSELDRLADEISFVNPNLILALGGVASWALLGTHKISKIRGGITATAEGRKILPAFHPSAILRQWDLRPVTIFDFLKAAREMEFPEVILPERLVYIEPSLADLEWFWTTHLETARYLAVDIETREDQITCIGFAPTTGVALVIPFFDPRRAGNYWPSPEEEARAWAFTSRCLHSPAQKIFQNGLYDIHFLWRRYGLTVANSEHDTMLLHHALQPESQKGLGFLGSVYTNEQNWKLTVRHSTIKKDE